ncbi:hypothetical protein BASA81_015147 [Batrachochytrium salamandrivorans]|nr:hypothetical protein BASA81_015147 [Batrachochytrium salamandrivorans]
MDHTLLVKLDHCLPEVRIRAVDTVLFKLRTGHLTVGEISRDGQLLQTFAKILCDPEHEHQYQSILRILIQIASRPSVQDRLVQSEAISTLRRLAQSSDTTLASLSKQLLVQIRNGPSSTASEPNSFQPSARLASLTLPSNGRSSEVFPLDPTPARSTGKQSQSSPRRTSITCDDLPRGVSIPLMHIRPPPYIPNAINSFEPLHLSIFDLETIEGFSSLIVGPLDNIELEEKLFDIISMDFGPQTFLQKSHILQLILSGLESLYPQRPEQSLIYLLRITDAWGPMFRSFVASPIMFGPTTPIPTTPNASMDGGFTFAMADVNIREQPISLSFACHEILRHLTVFLRPTPLASSAMQIIERIAPFLKIHAESILCETSCDLNPIRADEMALFYFSQLTSQTKYFSAVSNSQDDMVLLLKHQILSAALLIFNAICDICEDSSDAISGMLSLALMENGACSIVIDLTEFLLRVPSSDTFGFINWAARTAPSSTAIEPILRTLLSHIEADTVFQNSDVAHRIASLLVYSPSVYPVDCTKPLGSACTKLFISHLSPRDLFEHSFLIQSMSSFTAAVQLDILEKCRSEWTHHEQCLFLLRCLFHRHESISHASLTALDVNSAETTSSQVSGAELRAELSALGRNVMPRLGLADDVLAFTRLNSIVTLHAEVDDGVFHNIVCICEATPELPIDDLWKLVTAIRIFCETIPSARAKIRLSHFDFLLFLLKVSDAATLAHRLEFSRLCFVVVFVDLDWSSSSVDCGSTSLMSFKPQLLPVPPEIHERFHIYGPTRHYFEQNAPIIESCVQQQIIGFIRDYTGKKTSVIDLQRNITYQYAKRHSEALIQATSHDELRKSLDSLSLIASLQYSSAYMGMFGADQAILRFLTIKPLSIEDYFLLEQILRFIRKFNQYNLAHLSTYHISIERVLLPLLRHHMNSLEENDTPECNDSHAWTRSTEIVAFLSWIFHKMPVSGLTYISASTSCIHILKDYTHQIFAAEGGKAKNHRERINCLSALLSLISLPTLSVSVGGVETMAEMIHLLVQVLGYSQQNHMNSTNGNTFTYKDRSIYKWVALCVRNLSRAVIHFSPHPLPWGDHWFFHGELEWLLNLLHDDEKIMQKYGLGILGNLILIKGSSVYIEAMIPQYLDMAFLFALDTEQHISKRKESLMIINNFVATAFQGPRKSAKLNDSHMGKQSAERLLPESDLIHIFEGCGFFEQFDALLCYRRPDVAYMAAVSELFLRLVEISPGYIGQRLQSVAHWSLLLEHTQMSRSFFGGIDLSVPHSSDWKNRDLGTSDTPLLPSLHFFENSQWRIAYHHLALITLRNIHKSIHCLTYTNGPLRHLLIGQVDVLNYVGQAMSDLWELAVLDTHTQITDDTDPWWDALMTGFALFADLVLDTSTLNPESLVRMFNQTHIGERMIQLAAVALQSKQHVASSRAGCIFLSRVFVLHYGEVVALNLDAFLGTEIPVKLRSMCSGNSSGENTAKGATGSESHTSGDWICQLLIQWVVRSVDADDAVLNESVRLALQCLLGKCEFAKTIAISAQLIPILARKSNKILKLVMGRKDKPSETEQSILFVSVSLFRHLFAGSTLAKLAGVEHRITVPISDILVIKNAHERLILECLGCLRNLITNCDAAKQLVLASKGISVSGTSVLDGVCKIYKDHARSIHVFCAAMEVMKLLVLGKASRAALFKANINVELCSLLEYSARQKDMTRSKAVLGYFINASYTSSGRAVVMRITGLLPLLMELLGPKPFELHQAVLTLLLNLAIARENKAHLLADENFIPKVCQICSTGLLKTLALVTSLVRVLLYDFEKAKFEFKRRDFNLIMVSLDERLRSDYAMYLNVDMEKKVAGSDGGKCADTLVKIDREDGELLNETLTNASLILRLLA